MTAAPMRLRRTVLDEAPFAVVLAVVAAGFSYSAIAPQHWLRGVILVAAGMVLAGLLRSVLPEHSAGLLSVRGKTFDTVCYLALGGLVFGFGILLPR